MLRGWFDAFRSEGGPTLYSLPNRTAVTEDIQNIIIYVSFTTIFVAFLIVFPGIRKEKLSTFISVTISLFIGAVILVSNHGSEWHVAHVSMQSPYRAFSLEKISAHIGVKVGLNSVNITLRATTISASSLNQHQSQHINYNERFHWVRATEMRQEYRAALVKGLPFPLLTVAEYFTQELEGFCWGYRYRLAGYYSHILLWSAFGLWLLMNILLCTVPRYAAYTMQAIGALMLLANAVYAHLLPFRPLIIPFEGGAALHFQFGWCFWLVMAAGASAVIVGGTMTIVDLLFPHKFSTILEVDYGMPYRNYLLKKKPVEKANEHSYPKKHVSTPSDDGFFENETWQTRRELQPPCTEKYALGSDARHTVHGGTEHCFSSSKDFNVNISAALW